MKTHIPPRTTKHRDAGVFNHSISGGPVTVFLHLLILFPSLSHKRTVPAWIHILSGNLQCAVAHYGLLPLPQEGFDEGGKKHAACFLCISKTNCSVPGPALSFISRESQPVG